MLDFAIDLRQALFAAHGKQRVAKRHENSEHAKERHQPSSLQEAQRARAELEILHGRRRRDMSAPNEDRIDAHIRRKTTIAVVICITCNALPLDSSMPLMFCHQ